MTGSLSSALVWMVCRTSCDVSLLGRRGGITQSTPVGPISRWLHVRLVSGRELISITEVLGRWRIHHQGSGTWRACLLGIRCAILFRFSGRFGVTRVLFVGDSGWGRRGSGAQRILRWFWWRRGRRLSHLWLSPYQ